MKTTPKIEYLEPERRENPNRPFRLQVEDPDEGFIESDMTEEQLRRFRGRIDSAMGLLFKMTHK